MILNFNYLFASIVNLVKLAFLNQEFGIKG
jgi:hypothetical protein